MVVLEIFDTHAAKASSNLSLSEVGSAVEPCMVLPKSLASTDFILKPETWASPSMAHTRMSHFQRRHPKTGFSHCTKIVPVKSYNDLLRPLVEKGVV